MSRPDIERIEEVVKEGTLEKVNIYEKSNPSKPAVTLENFIENQENFIRVTFMHRRASEVVPLTLTYSLYVKKTYAPIHLRSSPSDFNMIVKRFYAKLWLSDQSIDLSKLSAKDTIVTTKEIRIKDVDKFCRSIGRPEISSDSNKY